ncbi:MAG TPA: hypothetical protein VKY65_04500 [Alphaproteobacteria bacterium]|nr:hypothetical protein [Alphaproteobacteria bacterium]
MAGMGGVPLTDAEFGLVQRFIDRIVEENLELGLSSEIEHDFDMFARMRRTCGFLYPTFDPCVSDLGDDALWVRAVTPFGDTVAMSAARVFETDDFYELIRNERVWFRTPPPDAGERCKVQRIGPFDVRGVVAHVGGLWVNPAWRKRGLSRTLPWLVRALLLRNFGVDHVTSLVFEGIAFSGLPKNAYGFTTVGLVIDGFFPPTEKDERVYMCHITRQEILQRMEPAATPAAIAPAAD